MSSNWSRGLTKSRRTDTPKEMYFVLLMRFKMFVEHELTDSSDDFLGEWSVAAATKFNKNHQQKNFSGALHDLLNFVPDVAEAAPAPAPAARGAPPGGLADMWEQLSPTPATPRTRKRARTVEVPDSEIELDNEMQPETPNTGTGARSRRRGRSTHIDASVPSEEQTLTQTLAVMKTDPSAHHQQWLG